jgi:hypothetical protein
LFACFLVVMFFAWVFNSCLRFVVSIMYGFVNYFFVSTSIVLECINKPCYLGWLF